MPEHSDYQFTQGKDLPADDFQLDLHPDLRPDQNAGALGLTAADVKELHARLPEFSTADLKQIPIVPEGTRLEDGSRYLDLADPQRREFTASGGMVAAFDHYYVPKSQVDYVLWNRLIGVDNPERLQQADDT